MSGKIVVELTPEQARCLLWLINNTETILDNLQKGEDFSFNTFTNSQIMNLEGISELTDFLESIFGKSDRKKKKEWQIKIEGKPTK